MSEPEDADSVPKQSDIFLFVATPKTVAVYPIFYPVPGGISPGLVRSERQSNDFLQTAVEFMNTKAFSLFAWAGIAQSV